MSAPVEVMTLRRASVQKAMAKEGLEGLLVYANQMKTEPLFFLSNYTLLGDRAFCFLPLSGEPVLLISEAWDLARARKETQIDDIRVLENNWAGQLADLCLPVLPAVAGREIMGRRELEALEASLKGATASASAFLTSQARVKSPYELDLIRKSARMADAGFMKALSVIREGLSDYELVAEIDYAMRQMGATDNFQMLAVGKQNSGMLLPWGKEIEPGDLLLFEITPANTSETYSAQLCRTAVFGEPLPELFKEKYGMLVRALEESLSVVKPGVKIGEVARIQNEIIEKAGYGDYCQPPFMRARGHGFGLGRIDIDEDSPLVFQEGMSFVVHPNQFLPETGYLALGEHVIVTAHGIERLTKTESKIYECPAKV